MKNDCREMSLGKNEILINVFNWDRQHVYLTSLKSCPDLRISKCKILSSWQNLPILVNKYFSAHFKYYYENLHQNRKKAHIILISGINYFIYLIFWIFMLWILFIWFLNWWFKHYIFLSKFCTGIKTWSQMEKWIWDFLVDLQVFFRSDIHTNVN